MKFIFLFLFTTHLVIPSCKQSRDSITAQIKQLKNENVELDYSYNLLIKEHKDQYTKVYVDTSLYELIGAVITSTPSEKQKDILELIYKKGEDNMFSALIKENDEYNSYLDRKINGLRNIDSSPKRTTAIMIIAEMLSYKSPAKLTKYSDC
jgi:hypothetical protein